MWEVLSRVEATVAESALRPADSEAIPHTLKNCLPKVFIRQEGLGTGGPFHVEERFLLDLI